MKWQYLLILFLLISPASAANIIPWCYQQDAFLWNSTGDIGYRTLNNYPELDGQRSITTIPITASSGEVTLGTWITPSGSPDTSTLAPGLWRFRTYARASSDAGITTLKYRIFNRSSSGTITWLFFGNAFSRDISSGTVPAEYLTSYARRNYTTFFPGDRLGIQINVSTDSASARTVTLDVAGNTNASMVTIGYWLCSGGSGTVTSIPGQGGEQLPINPLVPIIACIVGIFALRRKQ